MRVLVSHGVGTDEVRSFSHINMRHMRTHVGVSAYVWVISIFNRRTCACMWVSWLIGLVRSEARSMKEEDLYTGPPAQGRHPTRDVILCGLGFLLATCAYYVTSAYQGAVNKQLGLYALAVRLTLPSLHVYDRGSSVMSY